MRKSPLAAFFFLAFLLSSLVAVPLALQRMGVLLARLPYSLYLLDGLRADALPLAVVAATEGRVGLRGFLARGFRLSAGSGWLVGLAALDGDQRPR